MAEDRRNDMNDKLILFDGRDRADHIFIGVAKDDDSARAASRQ